MEYMGQPGREDKTENGAENTENILDTLNGFTGAAFMDQVREMRKQDPDLEDKIKNSHGNKNFKQDVLSALHYIDREEKNHSAPDPTMERFYYPEWQKSDRRRMRTMYGTTGAVLGSLVLGIGISKYEMDKEYHEQEVIEQNWAKEKLPLTLAQIDAQADTIFQGITKNLYLYKALDTLEKTVDQEIDKSRLKVKEDARTKIYEYIDSVDKKNPGEFKDFTFEYWKLKNGLPGNENIKDIEFGLGISDIKNHAYDEDRKLDDKKTSLHMRLYAAYKNADEGKTIGWHEAVRQVENKQKAETSQEEQKQEPKQENKDENPELKKFTDHIDSLTSSAHQEMFDAFGKAEDTAIKGLEVKVEKINEDKRIEAEKIKQNTQVSMEKAMQVLRNKEAGDLMATLEAAKKSFSADEWEYLKNLYLVNEVFDLSSLQDSAAKDKLKKLESNQSVVQKFRNLVSSGRELDKGFKNELDAIQFDFTGKETETLRELDAKVRMQLAPITQELDARNKIKQGKIDQAFNNFTGIYNNVWNEELKKLGTTSIQPKY